MDEIEAAERLAGWAQAALQAAEAEGSDRTGAVTVRLNNEGRVVDVRVATDWQRHVKRSGLGAAVREAAYAAAVARLAVWGEVARADHIPVVLPVTTRPPVESPSTVTDLLAMTEQLEQELERLRCRLRNTHSRPHSGVSPGRAVTVRVTAGGEITDVRYDLGWLARARPPETSRRTTAAFAAAYRSVDRDQERT